MIPFCRTPEEGERVVALMAEHGLRRGERGLEIYVMCEIPSNVLQAREFARIFDGFSIGSNDLTQLVLGVDRDSAARRADLRRAEPGGADDGRLRDRSGPIAPAGRSASAARRRATIRSSPRFLVERGITSISLNPDALIGGLEAIAAAEASATIPARPIAAPLAVPETTAGTRRPA